MFVGELSFSEIVLERELPVPHGSWMCLAGSDDLAISLQRTSVRRTAHPTNEHCCAITQQLPALDQITFSLISLGFPPKSCPKISMFDTGSRSWNARETVWPV